MDVQKWRGEDFYSSDENLKRQDVDGLLEWSKKQAHFPLLAGKILECPPILQNKKKDVIYF